MQGPWFWENEERKLLVGKSMSESVARSSFFKAHLEHQAIP
jgi:hypothetical protein